MIKDLSSKYLITTLCNELNFSISAYYYHLNKKEIGPMKFKNLKDKIVEINKKHPKMGHRRIELELLRKYNVKHNRKTILRYMNLLDIKVVQRKKKYTLPRNLVTSKIFENEIKRDFKCVKPNQKWSIDITYLPLKNGDRSYMVCIKDLFDKSIVKHKVSSNMEINFVIKCLEEAFIENTVNSKGLILHSDQGVHFSCLQYLKILEKYNVIGSHSRRGNCLDNSPIESFFSLYKNECLDKKIPYNHDEVVKATSDYMVYYNKQRYQLQLNGMSPHEFRKSM